MPLADVSSTFLEESAMKVRSKPVPWEVTIDTFGLKRSLN